MHFSVCWTCVCLYRCYSNCHLGSLSVQPFVNWEWEKVWSLFPLWRNFVIWGKNSRLAGKLLSFVDWLIRGLFNDILRECDLVVPTYFSYKIFIREIFIFIKLPTANSLDFNLNLFFRPFQSNKSQIMYTLKKNFKFIVRKLLR